MDYLLDGIIGAAGLLFSGDEATLSAVAGTIKTSTLSILLSTLIGLPVGFTLGGLAFPGRNQLRMIFDTLLALPTVVVGLIVYGLISTRGPLGFTGLLYTIPGMAAAQTVLILPLIISLTASAVESLDVRVRQTLFTLGATRRQIFLASLAEARFAVLMALVTAYGRAISEVGVSMIIGGNIKWHTRTITTAIALETGKGEFAMGIALGLVLLSIVFLVNAALSFLRRRSR